MPKYDEPPSNLIFIFNFRRYVEVNRIEEIQAEEEVAWELTKAAGHGTMFPDCLRIVHRSLTVCA
jgi:hypothetical protein